jgi:hypothetical protein
MNLKNHSRITQGGGVEYWYMPEIEGKVGESLPSSA